MAPKKQLKSTRTSTSRAEGNPPPPHVVKKYCIVFVDDDHSKRYDVVVPRKIYAPNYIDQQMLDTLDLLDFLRILLGRLGSL